MGVVSALGALEAMRCEGVVAERHYGVGVRSPDILNEPALAWRYSVGQEWPFDSVSFDVRSGVLGLRVSLSLVTVRFVGSGQEAEYAMLPTWADRLVTMLGADMRLGDNLSLPLSAFVSDIGFIDWRKNRYIGIEMQLDLPVRIEQP